VVAALKALSRGRHGARSAGGRAPSRKYGIDADKINPLYA
jgi:hypothetical protein